jgi:hypothetical protein
VEVAGFSVCVCNLASVVVVGFLDDSPRSDVDVDAVLLILLEDEDGTTVDCALLPVLTADGLMPLPCTLLTLEFFAIALLVTVEAFNVEAVAVTALHRIFFKEVSHRSSPGE